MSDDATRTLTDAAKAVSGPGTPDSAAVVAKPETWAVRGLVLAGPALSVMVMGCVGAMVFIFWPDAVAGKYVGVMTDLVRAVGTIASVLAAILGVVVFRLASGGLKRVEAKAGPAGITVETGDPSP